MTQCAQQWTVCFFLIEFQDVLQEIKGPDQQILAFAKQRFHARSGTTGRLVLMNDNFLSSLPLNLFDNQFENRLMSGTKNIIVKIFIKV